MSLHFSHAWVLGLLPLAGLPWLRLSAADQRYSWIALLPPDPWSDVLGLALKILAGIAIAGCVLGMADPLWTQPPVEHVGRGAQIVLLLDRSRSMDQAFAGKTLTNSVMAESTQPGYESKGGAARRLLAEFVRERNRDHNHDLIAMLAFTTIPIGIIGFTQHQELVQAAISAGNEGRGLAETDVGLGILAALSLFRGQPYNGSRVILMVSDGGAHLDLDTQNRIRERMKRERASLYWLYLRANRSPGLLPGSDLTPEEEDRVPEHFLHRYFLTLGAPYHAYEAENPDALQHAIDDVGRLENLPIRYRSARVDRNLAHLGFGAALISVALLMIAHAFGRRPWPAK